MISLQHFPLQTDRKVKQSRKEGSPLCTLLHIVGSPLCTNPILRLNFLPPAARISQLHELNVGHSVVLLDQADIAEISF